MELKPVRIGRKIIDPLGIPSGCVVTSPRCLERILNRQGGPGFASSKSYGTKPRVVPERDEVEHPVEGREYGYREPIFQQFFSRCFENAVGLTNPGDEVAAQELSQIHIPKDKAVIGSVYGKNIEEFVRVAGKIAPYVDAIEGNESCPHVKGHGMALCDDLDFVSRLPGAVKAVIGDKPFYVKLPPVPNIAELARISIAGGADGIVLINTERGYSPLISNGNCGISGKGIKPLGIRCTRDVRQAVGKDVLIIAGAGIEVAEDALEYFSVGANAITIGSGLVGMTENDIVNYFPTLKSDLENGTDNARNLLKEVDTNYKRVKIEEIVNNNCDFKVYRTNGKINCLPGQFVFAMLPGNMMPNSIICEKPFSIMDDDPLTLGVLTRGYFTERFNSLKRGDEVYFRGPYGRGVEVENGSNVVLVGGGCGIAGLYLLAKRLSEKNYVIILLGAKDKEHLPYLEKFSRFGDVRIATEDGSLGIKGMVADLFHNRFSSGSYFFNCGPKAMVEAVLPSELEISSADRVYSSVDYMTRCGVGICGSCANEKGLRTCVEGPFMRSRLKLSLFNALNS